MGLKKCTVFFLMMSLYLNGCASIVSGTSQEVSFQTNPDGALVKIAGKEIGKTPTTVQLDRESGQTLEIAKDGYQPIRMDLKTGIEPWFWGNIIFGGLLGSTTDGLSGAATEYAPNHYYVTLFPEGTTRVERPGLKDQKDKAKEYILTNYDGVVGDIRGGGEVGENLSVVMEMLHVSEEKRKEELPKMQSVAEVFSAPPEFADQLMAIFIE